MWGGELQVWWYSISGVFILICVTYLLRPPGEGGVFFKEWGDVTNSLPDCSYPCSVHCVMHCPTRAESRCGCCACVRGPAIASTMLAYRAPHRRG